MADPAPKWPVSVPATKGFAAPSASTTPVIWVFSPARNNEPESLSPDDRLENP
jgi:hypothetical protein